MPSSRPCHSARSAGLASSREYSVRRVRIGISRSFGNLIETPDGRLKVIDPESGMVAPLASPRAWRRALRRRLAPIFDDVYVDITRGCVIREAAAMRAKRGYECMTNSLPS